MKYFILAFSIMFASSIFAMGVTEQHELNVQQKLKETPEMSNYCKNRLEYLQKKIKKWEGKLAKENNSWNKAKVDYYRKEYKDWVGYCTPKQ